jgi:hypothetical protein
MKKGFNINLSLKTTNHYKFSVTKIILHLNVYNRYCFYRLVLFSVLKGFLMFIVPSDNIIEKTLTIRIKYSREINKVKPQKKYD